MKKVLTFVLSLVLLVSCIGMAFADEIRVAFITDSGDITDQSFNQSIYEAARDFCANANIEFAYYKPASGSDSDLVAMYDKAIDDGFNVIIGSGYANGTPMAEEQSLYPEVTFIGPDISASDLDGIALESNTCCIIYREEISGYIAGYAAVKLGYRHLGFVGGMAVPVVLRYTYGFMQGMDAAAQELNASVTFEYVFANSFSANADITAYCDNWYQNLDVEIIFAAGGSIYTSCAEAAAKVGGKIIGVDTDQKDVIDSAYGEGMTVTSALKGLRPTINLMLSAVVDGTFTEKFGGTIQQLAIVSTEDMDANFAGIAASTQFSDAFTEQDYIDLVGKIYNGELVISDDATAEPAVSAITVNYLGNIK